MKEKVMKVVKKFWKLVVIFVIVCMAYVAGITTRTKVNTTKGSFFDRNKTEIMERVLKELEDGDVGQNVKVVSDGKGFKITADVDDYDTSRVMIEIYEDKAIAYRIYDVELDSSKWVNYLGDDLMEIIDLKK